MAPQSYSSRIESLDGLRGMAVCSVILVHSRPDLFPGGWIGVDLFFALSGYLVAAQLDAGRAIGPFYRARARRIVPPTVAMTTVVIIACQALSLPAPSPFAIPLANIERAAGGGMGPLGHLWSIAAEAQFYLAAPLMVALPKRYRVPAVLGLLAAAAVWRAASGAGWVRLYNGPDTHSDALLLGVLLALCPAVRGVGRAWPFAAACLAGLLFAAPQSAASLQFAPLRALSFVAGALEREWLGEALSHPGLRRMGRASFGLYLWHYPIVTLLQSQHVGGAWIVAVPIAVIMAAVSVKWFEPFGHAVAAGLVRGLSGSDYGNSTVFRKNMEINQS